MYWSPEFFRGGDDRGEPIYRGIVMYLGRRAMEIYGRASALLDRTSEAVTQAAPELSEQTLKEIDTIPLPDDRPRQPEVRLQLHTLDDLDAVDIDLLSRTEYPYQFNKLVLDSKFTINHKH